MALSQAVEANANPITASGDSDYGSDIDIDAWDDIFSRSELQATQADPSLAIAEPVLPQRDDADTQPKALRLARIRENLQRALSGLENTSQQLASWQPKVAVEYDSLSANTTSVRTSKHDEPPQGQERAEREPTIEPDIDIRTPLERFRTKPKKTLSVTDIVSPAWCELQYWYSLTKYGRIRRTPAMKQGSKIHKEKEREVHTEVPIETATKEDNFGLRLWNIIQGLRTLRATGLTRELEVFGLVDGEVIIGIIDELSYRCPDEEMEAQIRQAEEDAKGDGKRKAKDKPLPADQKTMTEFFAAGSQSNADLIGSQTSYFGALRDKPKTLYLVDIKTRQSRSLPKLGSQMRATQMQLMLYRRLLNDLAANIVDAEQVFQRYSVEPNTPFSDTFMAQLANFDLTSADAESNFSDEPFWGSQATQHDPLDEILSNNTLSALWAHMISEFARTIQATATSTSISPLLTAEFRASSNGNLMGRRCFAFDSKALNEYVHEEMRWWRGERRAQGVDVEEAYKCRMCEFSEKCEWRIEKVEEATKQARARRSSTRDGKEQNGS